MLSLISEEIIPLISEDNNSAYLVDPVFSINRNRVNAEIGKTLLRLKKNNLLTNSDKIISQLYNGLINKKNNDGSWNEIHPCYNEKSALVTSFVGEFLVLLDEKKYADEAACFVLSKELKPGYFLKSTKYPADCLNVNATCGAFLALYGTRYHQEEMIDAARRAAQRIVNCQFKSGAFPYTTRDKGSFHYHMNVPCIHYQGVTMFFLLKIQRIIQEPWLEDSLKKGLNWLSSVFKRDSFDWSQSGKMFSYYLSGAYGFAIPLFMNYGKHQLASLSLQRLIENTNGLVNRWEKATMFSLPFDVPGTFQTSMLGDFPLSHKLSRFGYGLYRQVARRNYQTNIKDELFHLIKNSTKMKTSTIEPLNNYPDLFMTLEVLDCLSYSL